MPSDLTFTTTVTSTSYTLSTSIVTVTTPIPGRSFAFPPFTFHTSVLSSSACTRTVIPPAPTQTGIVEGCTKWHTAQTGDYCYCVAKKYNIPLHTFMVWNPAVGIPNCQSMLLGYAYCIATCGNASRPSSTVQSSYGAAPSLSATTSLPVPSSSISLLPVPTGLLGLRDKYVVYKGNGSIAQGWPCMDDWASFSYL